MLAPADDAAADGWADADELAPLAEEEEGSHAEEEEGPYETEWEAPYVADSDEAMAERGAALLDLRTKQVRALQEAVDFQPTL